MSIFDRFVRWMIRIAFVLLVGVSVELHTQKKHFLILLLHILHHLSNKEHVAFVMLWVTIGGAAHTSDLSFFYLPVYVYLTTATHSSLFKKEQELTTALQLSSLVETLVRLFV